MIWEAGEPSGEFARESVPPLRVLVVDDDDDIRRLNSEMLFHSGYDVDTAADGEAAWDALSTDEYDLVITDNNMPKVTGVELLEKLRAARMNPPVIMATGTPPHAAFTRAPWLKPAALLIKPYTIDDLLRTVKQVLRASDETGEAAQPKRAMVF